jgi:hypothetical protein
LVAPLAAPVFFFLDFFFFFLAAAKASQFHSLEEILLVEPRVSSASSAESSSSGFSGFSVFPFTAVRIWITLIECTFYFVYAIVHSVDVVVRGG